MRSLDPLLCVLERLEDIWISQSEHRVPKSEAFLFSAAFSVCCLLSRTSGNTTCYGYAFLCYATLLDYATLLY